MTLRNTDPSTGIDCADVLAAHADFLDGLLTPAADAELRAHLDECMSCARYHRIVIKGLSLVHDVPDIAPSEDFEASLQHRIFHIEDEAALAPRALNGAAATFAVAAAIALLAWSPVLLNTNRTPATSFASGATAPAALTFARLGVVEPVQRQRNVWYATSVAQTRLAPLPGPYSPLVVQPPAQRWVRPVSSEYRPID